MANALTSCESLSSLHNGLAERVDMHSLTDIVPLVFLTVVAEMRVTEEQLFIRISSPKNESVPRALLCRTMILCYVQTTLRRRRGYYRPQMQDFESRWAKLPKQDRKAFIEERRAFVKQSKEVCYQYGFHSTTD